MHKSNKGNFLFFKYCEIFKTRKPFSYSVMKSIFMLNCAGEIILRSVWIGQLADYINYDIFKKFRYYNKSSQLYFTA